MENIREDRRVCNFCGEEYSLTESQMRQVKSKWPINCSRSCARKSQHARNHKSKRVNKKCDNCEKEFTVTNWDKDKKFCSIKCSSVKRFGIKDKQRMREKLNKILKDEAYTKYIKTTAWKITHKFGKGEEFYEDLLQEYFLALSMGLNTTIENVSKSFLRKELKRGITGKWNVDFNFSTMDAMPFIKQSYKRCTTSEFLIYIKELFITMTETERRFIIMYLKGFTDREVMKEIRKIEPMGNDKFYREKRRIFKELDYSSYGDNYKKKKHY